MPGASYDEAISIPTLIGSVLSSIAAAAVLTSYAILPIKRHFRHALIINLAIADFINATNNAISGMVVIAHKSPLNPGPKCSVNGWVGQLTVQAVDFSILSIAIVSLLAVTGKIRFVDASLRTYIGFSLCIWIIPLITSTTALGLDLYRPVTGNWCWITGSRLGLRYALGHGWRIAIILLTIGIYVRLWIFLRRHHRNMRFLAPQHTPSSRRGSGQTERKRSIFNFSKSSHSHHSNHTDVTSSLPVVHPGTEVMGIRKTEVIDIESVGKNEPSGDSLASPTSLTFPPVLASPNWAGAPSPFQQELESQRAAAAAATSAAGAGRHQDQFAPIAHSATGRRRSTDVTKILLMNGYPILYVILWLPGLLNRLFESMGISPRWLSILQSSTQFVGLANAITYGYNENIKRQIKERWAASHRRPSVG